MSRIIKTHFIKLFFRSALFIAALILYIVSKVNNTGNLFLGFEDNLFITGTIWAIFASEVIMRFFTSKRTSPGCQKHLKKNFVPSDNYNGEKPVIINPVRTFICAFLWILLNSCIFVLFFMNIVDEGFLILLSIAYSVCDIICILFFCPFRLFILKNKCCTSCRIYNWDYAMMFTPLLFIRNAMTASLLVLSLILLVQWEIAIKLHPERFSRETNKRISCANCNEKLCVYYRNVRKSLRKKQSHNCGQ